MSDTPPPDALQRQLRYLTVAVWATAVAIALMAGALWFSTIQSSRRLEAMSRSPVADAFQDSACPPEAFVKNIFALMEGGKYKEIISESEARLKKCRADHYAMFYKAKALAVEERWDEALETLKRLELLRPDWRAMYVSPLREAIEWNRAQKK